MEALKVIIPVYFVLFMLYGVRNPKRFLLLTGVCVVPLKITYTFQGGVTQHVGWTSGIFLYLSDVSFVLLSLNLIFFDNHHAQVSSKILRPFILLILAIALSKLNSTAGMLTFYQLVMFMQLFFFYYLVMSKNIVTEDELFLVVLFLTISLLFQSIIANLQFYTGKAFDIFTTGKAFSDLKDLEQGRRVYGTMGSPNGFASYIVPLALLNFSMLIGKRGYVAVRFASGVLGSLAIFFTFSRGGWLSFAAAFLFLLWNLSREEIIRLGTMLKVFAVFSLVIVIPFSSLLVSRIGYHDQAAMSRIPLMKIAVNMIEAHPFLGVGANTFKNVIHSYTNSPDLQDVYLYTVHNTYLLFFSETGLIGFIAFIWLMMSIYKESMLCIKQKKNMNLFFIGQGLRASIIAVALHMLVEPYFSYIQWSNLLILASLSTAARRLVEANPDFSSAETST